jgi:tripartite-type tricarboxylate transporter receptor subunit TctC
MPHHCFNRRHFLAQIGLGLGLTPIHSLAQNTTLTKPARIVVGFTPGGSADLIARALALQLGAYAPSVIVENKPGAGGRIALEAVRGSEFDGSTMVVTPSSMLTLYPHVYKKLNYDPLKDFAPVAEVASFSFVLVVGSLVPTSIKTLADFVTWCKANPKLAAYASSGNGSTPHFAGVALARATQTELTHVAYKGGAPAMNDVIGGQIAANIAVVSNALPHIQSGKLRALAVTGSARSTVLPQVPTMQELGFTNVKVSEWFGVFLPSKTPADVVAKLSSSVQVALKSKALQEVLLKASFDLSTVTTPADTAKLLRTETEYWAGLVKASGFTPED